MFFCTSFAKIVQSESLQILQIEVIFGAIDEDDQVSVINANGVDFHASNNDPFARKKSNEKVEHGEMTRLIQFAATAIDKIM